MVSSKSEKTAKVDFELSVPELLGNYSIGLEVNYTAKADHDRPGQILTPGTNIGVIFDFNGKEQSDEEDEVGDGGANAFGDGDSSDWEAGGTMMTVIFVIIGFVVLIVVVVAVGSVIFGILKRKYLRERLNSAFSLA